MLDEGRCNVNITQQFYFFTLSYCGRVSVLCLFCYYLSEILCINI